MFFELAFLFMLGSVSGWIMELFFRRFVSMKKWINPGFLNGPYLPMYGCGTVLLFGACFIPLPRWAIILILTSGLILLEYVTGLIFIKGMKIKLWDYSDRRGNIQGIICPLFSLFGGSSPQYSSVSCLNRYRLRLPGRQAVYGYSFLSAFFTASFLRTCASVSMFRSRSARRPRSPGRRCITRN